MSLRVSTSRPRQLGLLGAHVQRRADELGEAGEERLLGEAAARSPWRCRSRSPWAPARRRASVTRTFDGLRSRWMIPFWWACCTAWQTWTNSSSRSAIGRRSLVAVVGDRDAADQLHHEVGAARLGGAGVEDPGRCWGGPSGPGPGARPRTGRSPACVSMPGLMIFSATLRRTGCVCSAM